MMAYVFANYNTNSRINVWHIKTQTSKYILETEKFGSALRNKYESAKALENDSWYCGIFLSPFNIPES